VAKGKLHHSARDGLTADIGSSHEPRLIASDPRNHDTVIDDLGPTGRRQNRYADCHRHAARISNVLGTAGDGAEAVLALPRAPSRRGPDGYPDARYGRHRGDTAAHAGWTRRRGC